jgi:hypothetical protein
MPDVAALLALGQGPRQRPQQKWTIIVHLRTPLIPRWWLMALVQIDDAVIRKIADPGRNSSCELGMSKLQLLS